MHKATLSTKTFVHCPNCGDAGSSVDHLTSGFSSKWHCDCCGVRYRIEMSETKEIKVGVDDMDEMSVPCAVLLELPPQAKSIYFVLKSRDYGRAVNGERFEGADYYYNEHTCPTNWFRKVEIVASHGDCDPHGLFRYVASQDVPDELKEEDFEEFACKTFPQLQST